MALNITKDLLFDKYGDFAIEYGDIVAITDTGDIFYQNTVHRLISKFNDYKDNPSFGPNIPGDVGKPVSQDLANNIKNRILYVLTSDNFLNSKEITVISLIQNDKIFFRINIYVNQGNNSLALEKITINTIFNPSSGLLYANNYTNV